MRNSNKSDENYFQLTQVFTRPDIGNFLKNERDAIFNSIEKVMSENNISQGSLARAIGSDQQHISKILRKRSGGLTINVLIRISKALNTPISELAKS